MVLIGKTKERPANLPGVPIIIRSQPFDGAAPDIINGRLDVYVLYLRVLIKFLSQPVRGVQSVETAGRVRVAFFPHGLEDIIRDILNKALSPAG